MSNLQPNKLKSGINNGTEVTLNLSPNVIGDSNDEANFSHKLSLTDRRVSSLGKNFANNSSAYCKITKTSIVENSTICKISWQTSTTITKSWFTFNKKCT